MESTLKSVMQPLHMTADDWARSLDGLHDVYGFESALNICCPTLNPILASSSIGSVSPQNQEGEVAVGRNHIISPGDSRIWHRRVKDWVNEQLLSEIAQSCEDSQDSAGMAQSASQHRVDLVEALMIHGILQEHDLHLLSSTDFGSDKFSNENTDRYISPMVTKLGGNSSVCI
jgi:hypothetical protein